MQPNKELSDDIEEACWTVLRTFGMDRSDILTALIFGSRARGAEKVSSDFDLIFIVLPHAFRTDFVYRRIKFRSSTIDANVIQLDAINRVCQQETGWAYRLYRPRPIPNFSNAPKHFVDAWLEHNDSLIRHPLAYRRRLLWHLADCRALLKSARRLETSLMSPSEVSALSAYLMLEALFLVPLIQMNSLGRMPFEAGSPWSSARAERPIEGAHSHGDYEAFLQSISRSVLFGDIALDGNFEYRLKHLRDRCRSAIVARIGYVFRDGFGSVIADKAKLDSRLLSDLSTILAHVRMPEAHLIDSLKTWTAQMLRRVPEVAARAGHRKSLPRRKSKLPGTRFVEYLPEAARLKIIMPTGGCRVPTCTFCMLPYLARTKSSAESVIDSAASAVDCRPVRQVSIYTDGSFFDERELAESERLSIADSVRRWGASELLVESLPRFISPAALETLIRTLGPECHLRVGIGLQSTSSLVRKHITRTPISGPEFLSLMALRRTFPIALRIYLLANKPLMSASEDLSDLQQSLDILDNWLTPSDTVTVNPLLPTRGTLVERLEETGFWHPLGSIVATNLFRQLQAKPHNYALEFGPTRGATCNESDLNEVSDGATSSQNSGDTMSNHALLDPRFLPWSILGGFRSRSRWALTGSSLIHLALQPLERFSAAASYRASENRA